MAEVRRMKISDSEDAKEKNKFKRDRQNASLNRWKEKNVWLIPVEMPGTGDVINIRPGNGLGKVT